MRSAEIWLERGPEERSVLGKVGPLSGLLVCDLRPLAPRARFSELYLMGILSTDLYCRMLGSFFGL